MISYQDILYFKEIANVRHLSRAATRIGISQPALSHSIKRLELAFKTQLLIRSKKGVELTRAGQRLADSSLELTNAFEQLVRNINDDIEKPNGVIRVGCHTAVATYTIAKTLPRFALNYPNIQIQLHHDLSRKVTELVISDEIDIALAVNPIRHNDLILKELCQDKVTLWTSKNCVNSDLLIFDPSLIQSQSILKKMRSSGPLKNKFTRTIESSSLEVIAQLLNSGAGVAILPNRVVKAIGNQGTEPVAGAPVYLDRIFLAYKNEFRKLARGRLFIDSILSQKY